MAEGERMTFALDYRSECLPSLSGANVLDQSAVIEIETVAGGSDPIRVSHRVASADGVIYLGVEGGKANDEYRIHITAKADNCDVLKDCVMLVVTPC